MADRPLLAQHAAQRGQQLVDDDGRESFDRLVEQQHARVEHQRAAQRQHLLLAAGKLVAEVAPPFLNRGKSS